MSSEDAAPSRLGRRILIGVLLGLVVTVGLMLYSDASALAESLQSFDALVLLPVLGLSAAGYFLRYLKWEVYLRALDLRLPGKESALVFLAGLTMSITPGKIGEVLKSFLLRRSRGIPVATTAPIVVAERLTDLVALMLLASFGVISSGYGVPVMIIALGLTGGVIVAVAWPPASRLTIALVYKLPVLKRAAPKLERAYDSMLRLIAPRAFVPTLVLSLLAWGGEAVGTWLVLQGFGAEVGLADATFIFSFATVAGAVSMLPGGLVATEGSMIYLLTTVFAIAPTKQIATAATLLVRFCTLWFGVLVGVVALGLLGRVTPTPALPAAGDPAESPNATP